MEEPPWSSDIGIKEVDRTTSEMETEATDMADDMVVEGLCQPWRGWWSWGCDSFFWKKKERDEIRVLTF